MKKEVLDTLDSHIKLKDFMTPTKVFFIFIINIKKNLFINFFF